MAVTSAKRPITDVQPGQAVQPAKRFNTGMPAEKPAIGVPTHWPVPPALLAPPVHPMHMMYMQQMAMQAAAACYMRHLQQQGMMQPGTEDLSKAQQANPACSPWGSCLPGFWPSSMLGAGPMSLLPSPSMSAFPCGMPSMAAGMASDMFNSTLSCGSTLPPAGSMPGIYSSQGCVSPPLTTPSFTMGTTCYAPAPTNCMMPTGLDSGKAPTCTPASKGWLPPACTPVSKDSCQPVSVGKKGPTDQSACMPNATVAATGLLSSRRTSYTTTVNTNLSTGAGNSSQTFTGEPAVVLDPLNAADICSTGDTSAKDAEFCSFIDSFLADQPLPLSAIGQEVDLGLDDLVGDDSAACAPLGLQLSKSAVFELLQCNPSMGPGLF